MKDSRDISDSDRQKILQAIEKSNRSEIIITHGTFTIGGDRKIFKK